MPTLPIAKNIGLNCLRCTACRMLPDTDFAPIRDLVAAMEPGEVPSESEYEDWARQQDEAAPLIFCTKVGHRRRARLFRRCDDALNRSRWRLTEGGHQVPGKGNRTGELSEFERAFLRATWPTGTKEILARLHRRGWVSLLARGHEMGLVRDRATVSRALQRCAPIQRGGRVKAGLAFNDAQSDYILARFAAGRADQEFEGIAPDRVWPRKFSGNSPTERVRELGARNEAIKTEIIAQVAARGLERKWDAIRRHPEYKRQEYQERHKASQIERKKCGPKNNLLSRPQKRKTEL